MVSLAPGIYNNLLILMALGVQVAMCYKRCRIRPLVIALTMTLGAARGQSPDEGQLARFKAKARQDMTSIPNYTCLETIDRVRRVPHAHKFEPIDKVRLEVSSVAGKELFAWPGSHHFEDRDVTSFVNGGVIGTGIFAIFAHNLFVTGNGTFQYRGEEKLDGRGLLRCDFRLTPQESRWQVRTNDTSEMVAAQGSFWFDPGSLDLIRLEVQGQDLPHRLDLKEAVENTSYTRIRIGDSDALLPHRSELTLTHLDGGMSRDVTVFSDCHEYRSESTIRFDAPSPTPSDVPQPQVRQVDLPAGLLVPIEVHTAIDSKTAAVGDTLHGRVTEEVRYKGRVVVRLGADITGNICRLSRGGLSAVGIELSEIEWEGARAAFHAELIDLDRNPAGIQRLQTYLDGETRKVVINSDIPDAGIFYIEAARFRIAPGLHMLWRTLARSGRIVE